MSGLTDEGFEAKTLEEIKAEIEADQLLIIDPALDVSPEQPIGQINGIVASKLSELWDLCQTFANAMNPNAAENFLLDNVSALTGTTREPASKSLVSVDCTVQNGFTATAGQITLNVDGQPDVQFTNVDDIPAQTAGTFPFDFECTVVGPVQAAAGTLTVITSPVTGLTSVTNPLDAEPGAMVEQDASLRSRRQIDLTAPGACTVDSIRSDILQVDGVVQCYVFENVTLITDDNGLPGKSIEVVIHDGLTPAADDDEIAQAVWDSKPSGCETYGTTTETVLDSTSVERTVKFSRADVLEVYLEYDVTVDPSFFPATGDELIKEAAAAYGDLYLNLGRDVFAVAFKAQALTIPGVLDVPELRLGFSASPTGTVNLEITGREIADIDTSRITVDVTNGSP
jgi:uncharacterized phage protein gp47/JayE